MVLLTATSLKNLSQNGKFLLDTVNQNPFGTLALYYVVPRSLMAIAFFLCEHQCEPCCAQIDGKCLENETRQAL